jgi:hypothetical protein
MLVSGAFCRPSSWYELSWLSPFLDYCGGLPKHHQQKTFFESAFQKGLCGPGQWRKKVFGKTFGLRFAG